MARSIATLNSFGVTAFLDAAAMEPVMAALKGLDDRGLLTAWSAAAMPVTEPSFMFGIAGEELFATRESYRSKHVKPDFTKVFLDGVPGARTAAFHEPYTPDPILGCCFRGTTLATVPELVRWVGRCEELGLSVKIHCAGDAAVTQALDAIVSKLSSGSLQVIAAPKASATRSTRGSLCEPPAKRCTSRATARSSQPSFGERSVRSHGWLTRCSLRSPC